MTAKWSDVRRAKVGPTPEGARVVHIRDFPDGLPNDVVRIDRRSKWGNPFRIGEDGDRNQVIARYLVSLTLRLLDDPTFLEPLRGKRLACWCAPLACHGDIIARFIP